MAQNNVENSFGVFVYRGSQFHWEFGLGVRVSLEELSPENSLKLVQNFSKMKSLLDCVLRFKVCRMENLENNELAHQ